MTIGHLIILCGPSGSGKTTIQNILAERNKDLFRSISATSRAPRPGEVDGKDYHFISKDEFLDGINQWRLVYEPSPRFTFIEYTTYGGHFYGTPAEPLQDAISKGKTAIAVFDLRGAAHYQQKHVNATSIFIEPPDVDTLQARLEKRGSTNEETVRRLETALTEIKMGREELDYVVKNTNLEDSITQVHEIMIKATARWQNRHLLTDEQKALVEKELDLPITMREDLDKC